MPLIEMTVEGVGVAPSNETLVLLRDAERNTFLPIWIGSAEAVAIQMGLDSHTPLQPTSHELMAAMFERLGTQLLSVTITYVRDKIYYACLNLQSGELTHEVDARPSDAIALALRTNSPIFVSHDVIEQMGAWDEDSAL